LANNCYIWRMLCALTYLAQLLDPVQKKAVSYPSEQPKLYSIGAFVREMLTV